MSKATTEKATEQFQSVFVEPARAYGSLTLEYSEKLLSAQFDAVRAFTDLGLAQVRSWLDVKDPESFKKVLEGQQKAAQDMGERFKGDAEKVVALSQEYLQKGQKLVEDSVKSATAATK
ncbi:phasin family protein [Halomonas sp. EGI 63088]|uniref:Phasin family protein n=1 Tax=Halomonas flagellata TaxID=2920385 RepID=A0ABS9RQI4_9GAMM|nr:phasin family protein [Halomonas flagellata]MCH4562104.1 phasin family protein [Halomonas flagellata]